MDSQELELQVKVMGTKCGSPGGAVSALYHPAIWLLLRDISLRSILLPFPVQNHCVAMGSHNTKCR